MDRIERKKLYRKAIEKWGLPLQLNMLMEESAELIQATSKVLRKGDKENQPWRNLAEEIADVEIMIEQIKVCVTWQEIERLVEINKHDKLLRLKKMLEEDLSLIPQKAEGEKK